MDVSQQNLGASADYARVLRRRAWWIVLALAVALLAAVAYLGTAAKQYTATASVIVTPSIGIDAANAAAGRTSGVVNLDTEAQIVKSTPVAVIAARALGSVAPLPDLVSQVTVSVPPNTTVLQVGFVAGTPQAAQAGAHAFAQAYLDNRKAQAEANVTEQIKAAQAQIDTLRKQLRDVAARILAEPSDSPDRSADQAQRLVLQSSIQTLTAETVPLQTTQVTPGSILTDASLPQSPSAPDKMIVIGSAIALGLVLGLGLALLVDRLDRRIRRPSDVTATGPDVLVAELGAARSPRLAAPGSREEARYADLRAAAMSGLPDETGAVAVAPIGGGVGGSVVASNLAVACRAAGLSTVLVVADPASLAPRLLRARPTAPTLAGALKDGSLPDLLPDLGADDVPVVWPGNDLATLPEKLRRNGMDRVLGELRRRFEVVVIESPHLDTSRVGLTLARSCDATLLVVEERRTPRAALSEAINRLRDAQVRITGAVLLRRGPRRKAALAVRTGSSTHSTDSDVDSAVAAAAPERSRALG